MPTDAIRATIELAKQQEQQHGYLAALFENYVQEKNHCVVLLPGLDPAQSLLKFTITYIDYVPDFIDSAREITRAANIHAYSEPFLALAEEYFLKPPEIINRLYGFIDLMDEAYLAHRLLEEFNDRFMAKTTIPLTPFDMSMSNVLIHSLIGEPFANELDEAVQYTAERNMLKPQVYEDPAFKAFVHKAQGQPRPPWPCLLDKLSIKLPIAGL